MAQQLGVILTPFGANGPGWYAEINRAYGGKGTYLPQPGPHPTVDRFHNSRGEVGWYYDTQLGAIPTDAELAKTYVCYTPVATGEINAEQGFIPGPWRFGWDPAGKYGPPTSLSGLPFRSLSWPMNALIVGVGGFAALTLYRKLKRKRKRRR